MARIAGTIDKAGDSLRNHTTEAQMTRLILAAAASALLMAGVAWADDTSNSGNATKVEPGKSPTATMTEQVPTMKENCADQQAAAKPPGTEATAAIDKAVPPMKPGDKAGCPGDNNNSNSGQ
jgi:hypothetical protein